MLEDYKFKIESKFMDHNLKSNSAIDKLSKYEKPHVSRCYETSSNRHMGASREHKCSRLHNDAYMYVLHSILSMKHEQMGTHGDV